MEENSSTFSFSLSFLMMASSSSSSSTSSAPPPPPIPHDHFEDELLSDLEKDDSDILEKRFNIHANIQKIQKQINRKVFQRVIRNQTQWTRNLDAVQEHFSSHVTIDGSSIRLPHKLYALKLAAKHSWILYKKRECERRKRIRQRLEREKAKDKQGNPANLLLAMVDSCEACKRLYVTVNLFWGTTLCDACYFNPDIIKNIMSDKGGQAEKSLEITPDNVVEHVLKGNSSTGKKDVSFFFNPSITQSTLPPIPPPKRARKSIMEHSAAEKDASPLDEVIQLSPLLSTQSPSPHRSSSSPSEEEAVIHETDEEDVIPSQVFRDIFSLPPSSATQSQNFSQQLFPKYTLSQLSAAANDIDDIFDLPMTPYNDPLDAPGSPQ